jgi:hypothetical protein
MGRPDLNTAKDWTEMDLADFRNEVADGTAIAEITYF